MRNKKGQIGLPIKLIFGLIVVLLVIFLAYLIISRTSKGTAGGLEELPLVFIWPGMLIRQIQQRWRARKKGQLPLKAIIYLFMLFVAIGMAFVLFSKARSGARTAIGEQLTCPYYGKSTEEFQFTIFEQLDKKRDQEAYKWYKRFRECQEDGYLSGEKIEPLEETKLTESILKKYAKAYEDETKA